MSIGEYGGEYENHSTGILRICARNLSFTKASEECHVAQPAVSQQIRALEKELGFALFNRTTKGVTLTEAGRAYQGEITAILQNLDRSTRKARAISLGSAGSLIVGIANSGQTAVLGAIEQFSARYPEIHIELKRAHSLNQYQQLSQESFDVAITASPCLAGHNDIRMVGKRNSTLGIAMSKEQPIRTFAATEHAHRASRGSGHRSRNDAFGLWRRSRARGSVSFITRWLCRAPRHRVPGNARNRLGLSH